MPIKINSHKNEVQDAFDGQIEKALTIIGLTVERYAVEACPKDTGRLQGSITHKPNLSEKAVYIGTNVEYAPYVELGTSRQKAQPYLRPAATDHVDEYTDIVKRVLKGEF
jgi:HK97 gp10 family phage protein